MKWLPNGIIQRLVADRSLNMAARFDFLPCMHINWSMWAIDEFDVVRMPDMVFMVIDSNRNSSGHLIISTWTDI